MTRAPDSQIIAVRSWPDPPTGLLTLPEWTETATAKLSVSQAREARRNGTHTTAIGRDKVDGCVIEQMYAIPLKHPARPDRKTLSGKRV